MYHKSFPFKSGRGIFLKKSRKPNNLLNYPANHSTRWPGMFLCSLEGNDIIDSSTMKIYTWDRNQKCCTSSGIFNCILSVHKLLLYSILTEAALSLNGKMRHVCSCDISYNISKGKD